MDIGSTRINPVQRVHLRRGSLRDLSGLFVTSPRLSYPPYIRSHCRLPDTRRHLVLMTPLHELPGGGLYVNIFCSFVIREVNAFMQTIVLSDAVIIVAKSFYSHRTGMF